MITIALLVLAVCPWIFGNLKVLEIVGLGKAEFITKEEKQKLGEEKKQLQNEGGNLFDEKKYIFLRHRDEDIRLTLAGLRIALEEQLNLIAQQNQLLTGRGLRQQVDALWSRKLIESHERTLIYDLTPALNKAVHANVDFKYDNVQFVLELGLKLLNSLEGKVKHIGK